VYPTNYLPFQITYPRSDGILGYKDLTPRGGLAYDVFGNGKTSLKVNVGKYLEPASNGNGNYSVTNPTARLVTNSGVRAWTDGNKNFIPDCDLLNMSPNGECGQGNANFGKQVFATNYDPAILGGWGV